MNDLIPKMLVATAITAILAGAAGCTKERVFENIYEGVRMKEQAERQPADPEKVPGYTEYERNRQEIAEDNKTN